MLRNEKKGNLSTQYTYLSALRDGAEKVHEGCVNVLCVLHRDNRSELLYSHLTIGDKG